MQQRVTKKRTSFPAKKGDKGRTNLPALAETLRAIKITMRKTLSGTPESPFILCKEKSLHLSYLLHFPNQQLRQFSTYFGKLWSPASEHRKRVVKPGTKNLKEKQG